MRGPRRVLLALAVVLVAACSSDGDEASDDVADPDATEAEAAASDSTEPPGPAADATTIEVTGTITVDGDPLEAEFVGAVVHDGDLVTPCQAEIPNIRFGELRIAVLTTVEAVGCARPGASVVVWSYVDDVQFYSEPVEVPEDGALDGVTLALRSDDPRQGLPTTTDLSGEVRTADGARVEQGTVVARIGDQVCGNASIRQRGDFRGYILAIRRDAPGGACPEGAEVTFSVDETAAGPSITNLPHGQDPVDLVVAP